jgi:hypothetical protein
MSKSRLRASRAVATLCALTIGSSLIPTRVWADTTPRSDQPSPIRASVQRVATAHDRLEKQKVDRSAAVAAQSQQSGESAALESGSFFKTPVGIAVLAAFGAGVGYALYSASNDRIRSSGR